MCLQIEIAISVPEETQRIARAAFPKGSRFMTMRDELGTLFVDDQFLDLFPAEGQPAEAPWRLALVTVMQFAEGLSDRQAADAVRGRIDWKYALGIELTDSGFDASVLCEFRERLLEGQAEGRLFETVLQLGRERGWIKARGKQRTDSTHVLTAVRALNRIECIGETVRLALNALAEAAPDWLQAQLPSDWLGRYGRRFPSV
jgi:transposase